MKKQIALILTLGILLIGLLNAHTEEDFSKAEILVQQKISCDELTEDQLELIGEYYMEQMHPGEAHEYMDQMMGGEGSESLRQVHINMALRIYCREGNYSGNYSYGMMGMMAGYPGMMAGYNFYNPYSWFLPVIFVLIIVLLVILIFKQIKKK